MQLCVIQVKTISSVDPECCITLSASPSLPLAMLRPETHHEQPQGSSPCRCQLSSNTELLPQPIRPQTQCHTQQRSHAGPDSTAGAVLHSHQGSSPHLPADSACSSSFMPGRGSKGKKTGPTMPQWGENVTIMSSALGREEWQTLAVTLLRWGEFAWG